MNIYLLGTINQVRTFNNYVRFKMILKTENNATKVIDCIADPKQLQELKQFNYHNSLVILNGKIKIIIKLQANAVKQTNYLVFVNICEY